MHPRGFNCTSFSDKNDAVDLRWPSVTKTCYSHQFHEKLWSRICQFLAKWQILTWYISFGMRVVRKGSWKNEIFEKKQVWKFGPKLESNREVWSVSFFCGRFFYFKNWKRFSETYRFWGCQNFWSIALEFDYEIRAQFQLYNLRFSDSNSTRWVQKS